MVCALYGEARKQGPAPLSTRAASFVLRSQDLSFAFFKAHGANAV